MTGLRLTILVYELKIRALTEIKCMLFLLKVLCMWLKSEKISTKEIVTSSGCIGSQGIYYSFNYIIFLSFV